MTDPADEICLAALRRAVAEVAPEVPPDTVTVDRRLADLGLTSIDRAEVLITAMADMDITVPVSEFSGALDIGGLVALLRKHR